MELHLGDSLIFMLPGGKRFCAVVDPDELRMFNAASERIPGAALFHTLGWTADEIRSVAYSAYGYPPGITDQKKDFPRCKPGHLKGLENLLAILVDCGCFIINTQTNEIDYKVEDRAEFSYDNLNDIDIRYGDQILFVNDCGDRLVTQVFSTFLDTEDCGYEDEICRRNSTIFDWLGLPAGVGHIIAEKVYGYKPTYAGIADIPGAPWSWPEYKPNDFVALKKMLICLNMTFGYKFKIMRCSGSDPYISKFKMGDVTPVMDGRTSYPDSVESCKEGWSPIKGGVLADESVHEVHEEAKPGEPISSNMVRVGSIFIPRVKKTISLNFKL